MPRAIPSSKRAHFCTVCQKSFTTSGHLLRHSKVHTGEKKHKCPFPGCQTSCSRQDNLQQHYRIHLSPGSRRSASAFTTKSSPPPCGSSHRSPTVTAPITPPTHARRLSEDVPFTVVDGPPVLQVPPKHEFVLSSFTLPSPPNTPPPLVPASPRLVLLRQQDPNRRHSTGTIQCNENGYVHPWGHDESQHLLRPLSSSSCSSSSCSSPTPPFESFSHMISLGGNGCTSSNLHMIEVDDGSRSVWVKDDEHHGVLATPEEHMSTIPMTCTSESTKSYPFYQQIYDPNPIPDFFGYAAFPTSSHHQLPTSTSCPFQPPPNSLDLFDPSTFLLDNTPSFATALNSGENVKPLIDDQLHDSYPYIYRSSQSHSYPHPNSNMSPSPSQSLPGSMAFNNSGYVTHAPTTPQILYNQPETNPGFGWHLW